MTILWSLLTFLGSILPALNLIDPSDGFLIEVPAWIDYSISCRNTYREFSDLAPLIGG